MIDIFNSKGRMIDIGQLEVSNLSPDELTRFENLRSAYVENSAAEHAAAVLAKDVAELSAIVRAERIETQRQRPYTELQAARDWIATQAENARREREGR